LIDLDVLSHRRRVSCALLISDVLSCKIDFPITLSSLRLNVYLYNTRYRFLVKEDHHRTNYGMNEPLNGAVRIFNKISDLFEFGGTRDGFRVRINASVAHALGLELF
jgi:hypothetical protein